MKKLLILLSLFTLVLTGCGKKDGDSSSTNGSTEKERLDRYEKTLHQIDEIMINVNAE